MSNTEQDGVSQEIREGAVLKVPTGPAGAWDHRWRVDEITDGRVSVSTKIGPQSGWIPAEETVDLEDMREDIREGRVEVLRYRDTKSQP